MAHFVNRNINLMNRQMPMPKTLLRHTLAIKSRAAPAAVTIKIWGALDGHIIFLPASAIKA